MSTLTMTDWTKAEPPNYITNTDKRYAYSEVPYLGDYYLVKLPTVVSNLIYHVDYWGQGRIETEKGVSGFTDCYNINHAFQLVSNGSDKGRKIPNRIPVENFTNCDTTSYIKDNSVILVTAMGTSINASCAADIARMVHKIVGKVVVYGYEVNSSEFDHLAGELKNKEIYYCPGYKLPVELQGITLYDKHMAFLNVTVLKDEVITLVENASYDNAVYVTKKLNNEQSGKVIEKIIQRLFDIKSKNILVFAYKLWINEAQDVVLKYFPVAFKAVFSEGNVTIVNKEYHQAVELGEKVNENEERRGWAVNYDNNSKRITWKLTPVWLNDKLSFKMYNTECDMYLRFDTRADDMGDREVWGKKTSLDEAETYYLEPTMLNGSVVFYVTNSLYNQSLKLPYRAQESGGRWLWGHNRNTEWGERVYGFQPRFRWIISAKTEAS